MQNVSTHKAMIILMFPCPAALARRAFRSSRRASDLLKTTFFMNEVNDKQRNPLERGEKPLTESNN